MEDVNVGTDDWLEAVVALALALGIPEDNLNFKRSQMVQALRKKKQLLMNRGMLMTRMAALAGMVQKATRQQPQQQPAQQQGMQQESLLAEMNALTQLNEAFSELEAITGKDLEAYNILEPDAGPAMEASYEGSGAHEDTKLVIGIDPDKQDNKPLCVEITSPWDGTIHKKSFTNDKAGYKQAIDYANMLRTANLKTGGKPRGWQDEKVMA